MSGREISSENQYDTLELHVVRSWVRVPATATARKGGPAAAPWRRQQQQAHKIGLGEAIRAVPPVSLPSYSPPISKPNELIDA